MTDLQERIDNWFNCYKRGLLTWNETLEYISQDDDVPTAKLKKYFVYLDVGTDDVLKLAIPAKNEKDARDYVAGNGEVVAVRDVTERYPIDVDLVARTLINAGFGQTEVDLITRTLQSTNIAQ